jgi:hypothetical protein
MRNNFSFARKSEGKTRIMLEWNRSWRKRGLIWLRRGTSGGRTRRGI